MLMDHIIQLEETYCAHNYHPLPVVLEKAQGVYAYDSAGKRYIDMMGAYSAVSHGHAHPRLVKALTEQARRLAVVSRAFYTANLGHFLKRACEISGMDRALPMNTGAEAVETALKAARKWAYSVKKVPADQAEIIVCKNNFHGRTIAIISLSTETQYRQGFGPFMPGVKVIPFGDADALAAAITKNTAAFLVEPMQGEAGMVIPPAGYLKRCSEICKANNVLLIADEVQTGLGRTGKLFACEHDGVIPDGMILGKALGGGLLPVSLFLAREEVMNVFTPGDHGSTFGGNPLAAAVGLEALNIIIEDEFAARSAHLGEKLKNALKSIRSPLIREVRGKGLFIGVEIDPNHASARTIALKLLAKGILTKETHETVIRLAPPLVITETELDEAIDIIREVLETYSPLETT